MAIRSQLAVLTALAASTLLIGCAGDGSTPADEGSASGVQPLTTEACEALGQTLGDALGAEAAVSEAAWPENTPDGMGTGCEVTISGTGADFGSVSEAEQEIRSSLEAQGWTEDPALAAAGLALRAPSNSAMFVANAPWLTPAPHARRSPVPIRC